MANQRFTSKVSFVLDDREQITPNTFVTRDLEVPLDATTVRLTVEPAISGGKQGNGVKITIIDTSQSERSP
jgi:hypothetical protein